MHLPKTPAFAFLESVRPVVGSLCQNGQILGTYVKTPVKKPNSRKNPDLEYLEFFWNYLESGSRYYPC